MIYQSDLDAVLQEIVTRWGIPGLAVGIVEGDEVLYAKCFGVQSLDTQTPVTPDSIFCITSVSKCFVATAVVQLAEGGQINLEAPLVQYLPYFQLDDERYPKITIRHLLSHTSGLADLDESEYDELLACPEWDDGAAERFVRGLSNTRLMSDPGERFSYSNIGYNVLGDVIAKVSGRSFEAYLREQVLIRSGMPNSSFLLADVPRDRVAVPHLRTPAMRVNPQYPYHRADAPASFLHTTILDMCHWGSACLDRGRSLKQRVLTPAGYELMWTPVAVRNYPRPGMYEHMGLGWNMGHFRDAETVSHGGMGFGWSDFLLILPGQDRAAAILCNEESYARNRTVRAVAAALLDEKPQADTVSWMVPISKALSEGGIQAAYARYDEIKASGTGEYYFDANDLISLKIQLVSAKKLDLAIEVLGLNIHAFPGHAESYMELGKVYLLKGESALARTSLLKALSIEPENTDAARLLQAMG